MSIKNSTKYPLIIQLKQIEVIYHELVNPGETFHRTTGNIYFTIHARINYSYTDNPHSDIFLRNDISTHKKLNTTLANKSLLTLRTSFSGTKGSFRNYQSFNSLGWFAGYNHQIEIFGGNSCKFQIKDIKYDRIIDI